MSGDSINAKAQGEQRRAKEVGCEVFGTGPVHLTLVQTSCHASQGMPWRPFACFASLR
jgi:hypothetical protein